MGWSFQTINLIKWLKNSGEFVERIREVRIQDDAMKVSFDIVFLFTNIPVDPVVSVTLLQYTDRKQVMFAAHGRYIICVSTVLYCTYIQLLCAWLMKDMFTSTTEGEGGAFHPFLSVCVQDISKSCGRILTKLGGQVGCVARTN